MLELPDVPYWWLDKATIGIEAENIVAQKRQADGRPGGVQEALARIHGKR